MWKSYIKWSNEQTQRINQYVSYCVYRGFPVLSFTAIREISFCNQFSGVGYVTSYPFQTLHRVPTTAVTTNTQDYIRRHSCYCNNESKLTSSIFIPPAAWHSHDNCTQNTSKTSVVINNFGNSWAINLIFHYRTYVQLDPLKTHLTKVGRFIHLPH